MNKLKVLVFGITGMLGHVLFSRLFQSDQLAVYGTARSLKGLQNSFNQEMQPHLIDYIDVHDFDRVIKVFNEIKPDVVINCIGVIKQTEAAKDPIISIKVNALFPHQLSQLCKIHHARLVHVSTDCVFDGKIGGYTEESSVNATDLYGKTKALGEVYDEHCITLRTSIIGHELKTYYGLLEWFLSQDSPVSGFKNVIFSGLTTLELSNVILDVITKHTKLNGLYHLSAKPITKYDLLTLINKVYNKKITINETFEPSIDRSMDSKKYTKVTGYIAPPWEEMILVMKNQYSLRTNSKL